MRAILDRLGRPEAISWVTVVVAVSLIVPASYVSSLVERSGKELEFLLAVVLRISVLLGVLGLGRLALNRTTRVSPQPLVTAAVFLLAIVLSTSVFDALLVVAQLSPESYLWRRLRTTTGGSLAVLIASSLFVSYAREFSRSNAELRLVLEELKGAVRNSADRFDARKAELVARIRDAVDSALGRQSHERGGLNADVMGSLVDDVIRPLSYSLNREFSPESSQVVVPATTNTQWDNVVAHAFASNPFRWREFAALITIITTPFLTLNFGLSGFLGAVSVVGVCALFMVVGGAGWYLLPSRLGPGARALIFTLAHVPMSLLSGWFVSLISGYSILMPYRMLSFIVLCTLASWTATLVVSSVKLQRATNAALREAVEKLKRDVITTNNIYRRLNKGVSRVLHGPVQEAITASMLKLKKAGVVSDPAIVSTQIRESIEGALALLYSAETASVSIQRVFQDLEELWNGVVDIQFSVSSEDAQHIEQDPAAAFAVSELVREACSNAIRHGSASRIDISVKLNRKARVVDLVVANDGHRLAADAKPGLGSELFAEQTLSWSRKQVGSRVQVSARVPLTVSKDATRGTASAV